MIKPNIGISETNLNLAAAMLSKLLADETLLYVKTRKFHWNVAGDSFMEYHKLFEGQYKELEEIIDEVAERINKLGSQTPGTLTEYLNLTSVKESPGKYPDSISMVKELLENHEAIVTELRKNVQVSADQFKDAGTADFLTGLMETHETIAWKLRRYVG